MLTDEVRAAMYGHRETEWSAILCDDTDAPVRPLWEFTGGHLEQSRFQRIRGGGSLDLVSDDRFAGIDWGRARIRVEQSLTGLADPIPWGVYLVERPETTWEDEHGLAHATVTLMDKLAVPAQAMPTETYSIAEGANVTAAVVAILAALGETRVAVTESPLTMPAARSWPVSGDETTWLGIINDLLAVINYLALWCDGDGIYRISPHRPAGPGDSPAWTFAYGNPSGSLYLPEWSEAEDWYGVPNRVTLVTQGDEETAALVATATNTDPGSKYSTVARGRIIDHRETGIDAANLTTLQDMARRRLESLTTSVTNVKITTAPIPIWPNDRIDLASPSRAMETLRATSSSWSLELTPEGLMDHEWREVVSIGA